MEIIKDMFDYAQQVDLVKIRPQWDGNHKILKDDLNKLVEVKIRPQWDGNRDILKALNIRYSTS